MKDMLDTSNSDIKLKEYKTSYQWLFVILCVDLGVSIFYFLLGQYAKNNTWLYEYYIGFNAVVLVLKLPVFILAMIKVKPVAGKIVLLLTLFVSFAYLAEGLWRLLFR